jgi:hypothetical protein
MRVRSIEDPTDPGKAKVLAKKSAPAALGRPSLGKGRVAFTVSKRRSNSIRLVGPSSGKRRTLVRSRRDELLNPSLLGKRVLYVRVSRGSQGPLASAPRPLRQKLMLRKLSGGDSQSLHRRRGDSRRLWTTSLGKRRAFVTLLGNRSPRIISVKR